jgi:hypothetical protein
MASPLFTIRYRGTLHPDSLTLIVESEAGGHYLFHCRPDHCQLTPLDETELAHPALSWPGWQRVAPVGSYPLDALRSLATGAIHTHHLPPALATSGASA